MAGMGFKQMMTVWADKSNNNLVKETLQGVALIIMKKKQTGMTGMMLHTKMPRKSQSYRTT